MLGLKMYSYIENGDHQFYKTQKAIAKKMDILYLIPGSFVEEVVEGGENPMDMARRVNPTEFATRALVGAPEPLVRLHPGTSSRAPGDEVEEEEEEEQKD